MQESEDVTKEGTGFLCQTLFCKKPVFSEKPSGFPRNNFSRSHAPVIEPAEMCVNAIQLRNFRSATFRQTQ